MTSEEPPTNVLSDLDVDEDDSFSKTVIKNEEGIGETHQLEVVASQQGNSTNQESTVIEDGIISIPTTERQPHSNNQNPIMRRIIRRIRTGPEPSEGPSTSQQIRKIYIRKKRTPEEELALEGFEQESNITSPENKRIPAPPGKRGRRPIILPHDNTEPVSRIDAARRSGRPFVLHPSGVAFAIPSSLEAHPIQLSDTIPDNPDFDILKDDNGMPYCSSCHSVLRSFHALEYHMLSVHLKYKPYRCMFCVKEYFHTEEECIAHLKTNHIGKPIHIIRELKEDKEELLVKALQNIYMMVREDETLTQARVDGLQQSAYQQMQKYHRMRFKVPEVVARQRSQKDEASQTYVTMAAPQTLVQIPTKSPFMRREQMMVNDVKLMRMANGEVHQILADNRYIVERDMEMGDHEAFDQIDVVEEDLADDVHY